MGSLWSQNAGLERLKRYRQLPVDVLAPIAHALQIPG